MPNAPINTTTSGDQTILAAKTGLAYKVWKYFLIAEGQVTLTWKSGTTALSGPLLFGAGERQILDTSGTRPWFQTNVGEALILTTDATAQVSGTVVYEPTQAEPV